MPTSDKLTGKQAKFVAEYIICLNGTEAARRAQYGGDDRALAAAASRLLRNVKVLRALDEHLKQYAMSAAEVLMQLSDIARGDIADTLSPQGRIDVSEAQARGKSHLIKRIRDKVTLISDKAGNEHQILETEVEMYDRLAALDKLARFHSLLVDRKDVTSGGEPITFQIVGLIDDSPTDNPNPPEPIPD